MKGVLYPIVGIGGGGIKLRVNFNAVPPAERVEPARFDHSTRITLSQNDGDGETTEEVAEVVNS